MHTVVYPVNALGIGGAEQQLLELVRGLDKQQFRPIVATLYAGGPLEPEFRAVSGVELVDLRRRGKYDPATLLTMAQLLRSRRADIVQPFLTPATFFGLLPALLVRTPVKVVTERTGVQRFRGLGHRIYLALEDLMTRRAEAVVANSLAGRRLLISRGISPSKIRVFYNGVNPQRLNVDAARTALFRARLGVPPGGKVVAILASHTPAKDHTTFFHAAVRVSAARADVRYAIVGDGPLRAQLETLVADLGLVERVSFLGFQRSVADILAGCDLLVSSSRDNEGCSNSILEAMFLGTPVVATDVGGSSELVTDGVTGCLVPMQNPEALAHAIEQRLSDEAGSIATATRAREQALERFTLARMVGDYESLYRGLLGAASRTSVNHAALAQL